MSRSTKGSRDPRPEAGTSWWRVVGTGVAGSTPRRGVTSWGVLLGSAKPRPVSLRLPAGPRLVPRVRAGVDAGANVDTNARPFTSARTSSGP